MKRLPLDRLTPRLTELQLRLHRGRPEPSPYPPAKINDDLSDLSETEIAQEIKVIERRIEMGVVKPEGVSGLTYRLHRLQAQAEVVRRKTRKGLV